jgi:hypothetical protein
VNATARDNLVFLLALLAVLLFVAGATLCVVGWRALHRGEPKPTPKPRAANRNRQVSVPAHSVPLPVVYQEVTRLPVLDGDVTEVRDPPTRLDLLKHHTERGWRAREERAS